MATGLGTAVIDFGAYPGANEATVAVTGQTGIGAASKADVFVMGEDTTSDHTASDHRFADSLMALNAGTPTAGVGFTIYATSGHAMQGTFQVRWVWAD